MDLNWLKRLKWLRNLGPFEVQSEIFGVRSLSTLWYQHGTNLHHAEGWWSFPTGRYHCHWNQGHRLVVTSHSNRFSMKMLSYVPKWDCLSQFFSRSAQIVIVYISCWVFPSVSGPVHRLSELAGGFLQRPRHCDAAGLPKACYRTVNPRLINQKQTPFPCI